MNRQRRTAREPEDVAHVLAVSKIVWEWVVAPGWLAAAAAPSSSGRRGSEEASREAARAAGVSLYGAAGGLFPLVPRVCSLVARELFPRQSRYVRLWCAARAAAPACVKWIISHSSGGVDPEYIMGGSQTITKKTVTNWQLSSNRNKKACKVVFDGLLSGGYIDLALGLVNSGEIEGADLSGNDGMWLRKWGLKWPGVPGSSADIDMRENIRGSTSYRFYACCRGDMPLDSVKWLVGWLGMREPWELVGMVISTIYAGNAPVTQWLVETFNLAKFNDRTMGFGLQCARGRCPMLLKWWVENFSLPQVEYSRGVFAELLNNESSTVELCQWAKNNLDLSSPPRSLDWSRNPRCMRWAIEEYSLPITETEVQRICRCDNLEVIQWLVNDKSVAPKSIFLHVVGFSKDNVELIKWLAPRVTLSAADLQYALQSALHSSNTGIADWLESTFKVMNVVNSTPGKVCSIFVEIFGKGRRFSNMGGVKWFLQHVVDLSQITATQTNQVLLASWDVEPIFFVLETFHISLHSEPEEVLRHVLLIIFGSTIHDLQRLQSLGNLSVDSITKCLLSFEISGCSSKVVKWIVTHAGVGHIKEHYYTKLLLSFLELDKTHCAMWLIDTFHISMTDVMENSVYSPTSLYTWKLLVSRFPSLNAATIRNSCMHVVTSRHAIAQWTLSRFPLTKEDFENYFRASRTTPNAATKLWLSGQLAPSCQHSF
ncbi:hypothetical protein Pelo_15576 [Pelomyxa schiedti]|nr:hypothetical protein Pelo_15576 [Pelomyxa schiedti]